MNVSSSVRKLPGSIRELIESEPSVSERLERGECLERILASSERAADWASTAEPRLLGALRIIINKFASKPFELEALEKAAGEAAALTGAEARVSLARLRRSGIVFAVRKAWGDRLFYVPSDMVPIWQPIVLPVDNAPLSPAEAREVEDRGTDFRLPLSLELLMAWSAVRRQPLKLASKGGIHKPSAAKMMAGSKLSPESLFSLQIDGNFGLTADLPPHAALVLDLGLGSRVLRKSGDFIRVCETALRPWLALMPEQADVHLHREAIARYASVDAALHLLASAVYSLPSEKWFEQEALDRFGAGTETADGWLKALEAFGWLERGTWDGKKVFRKLQKTDAVTEPELHAETDSRYFIVQPDGEIVVPPDVRLSERWILEQIADRFTEDMLFMYRLTPQACERALNVGWSKEEVVRFLEQGSGESLPVPAADAIADWYSKLGLTKFERVTLLRAANPETADRLLDDEQTASLPLERVGDRDFIVAETSLKQLNDRLRVIGYPPAELQAASGSTDPQPDEEQDDEAGWIYSRQGLEVYEPDRTLPTQEDLFPGMSDIPAAWLLQPRPYHASTRKQLIQKAIGWRTAVRIPDGGRLRSFVPAALEEEGSKWRVIGRWQAEEEGSGNRLEAVSIQGDQLSEIMIFLPESADFETV